MTPGPLAPCKHGVALAASNTQPSSLNALGVAFTREPTQAGPVLIAVCSDTCGNLIQLYQPPK